VRGRVITDLAENKRFSLFTKERAEIATALRTEAAVATYEFVSPLQFSF
jgi:hypothetical protein